LIAVIARVYSLIACETIRTLSSALARIPTNGSG